MLLCELHSHLQRRLLWSMISVGLTISANATENATFKRTPVLLVGGPP